MQAVWSDVQASVIQFDVSTFGEGDKFADPLVADFSGVDAETISGVESVQIRRGRDDNLEAFGMGECTITINDEAGRYNPSNESGPLYGKLRPMRQVMVSATLQGQTRRLLRGFVRSIDYRAETNKNVAVITVGDLMLYLNRTKPVFTNQGRDTTTGEVIRKALDGAGWTSTALTSLQTGDVIPSPGVSNASTGQTALQVIASLMEIERGDFYIASDGAVTFKQRNDRAVRALSASFANVSGYAIASSDLDRVKNKAAVVKQTAVGDFTSEWSDGLSVANYGQQDFSTISSYYIYDAAQALALAQWLVTQRSNPSVVFRAIEITLKGVEAAAAHYALATELGDRISVTNTPIGSSAKAYFVEGIEHSILPSVHKIKYSLVPIYVDSLVLDSTTNGLLDTNVLAY